MKKYSVKDKREIRRLSREMNINITKMKCSMCKTRDAREIHHFDYSTPFGITLICKRCHCELHGNESNIRNASNRLDKIDKDSTQWIVNKLITIGVTEKQISSELNCSRSRVYNLKRGIGGCPENKVIILKNILKSHL